MLQVSHVRKQYSTTLAVDNVSLSVARGEVLGLLGPNGAGKTTTIRMVLNIIRPDAGSITFDGQPFNEQIRNRIGYLPEERGLYRKSSLYNTVLYFAGLKGIARNDARRRTYDWLKRFDLLAYHGQPVEALSKGNQQKVQFIISILHDPDLVILDEPFSGLDPLNQILLKDILMELRQGGKAIIFSTHQMDQAERLCDRLCLIHQGRVVLEGDLGTVKRRYGKNAVHVEFEGDGAFLGSLPMVKAAQVYENFAEIALADNSSASGLLRELAGRLEIRKFETMEPSLNSIFLEVVGPSSSAEQARSARSSASPGTGKPPAPPPPADAGRDPLVKKARTRMVRTFLIVAAIGGVFAARGNFDWGLGAIVAAACLASVYQYLKARNAARREPAGGGRGEKADA